MKYLLKIITTSTFVLLLSTFCFSQFKFGSDSIPSEGKSSKSLDDKLYTHVLGLDIGTGGFMYEMKAGLPVTFEDLETKSLSLHYTLHAITQSVRLGSNQLRLGYGLAFDFNRNSFTNNTRVRSEEDDLTIVDNFANYKKRIFTNYYATVPVMFQFYSNPDSYKKSLRIAAGMYGSMHLGSKMKLKGNDTEKLKIWDDFNLNRFKYGATARIGYRGFTVFGKMDLSPAFEGSEETEELGAYTIGLSVLRSF